MSERVSTPLFWIQLRSNGMIRHEISKIWQGLSQPKVNLGVGGPLMASRRTGMPLA
jgi:hypothetical protein